MKETKEIKEFLKELLLKMNNKELFELSKKEQFIEIKKRELTLC